MKSERAVPVFDTLAEVLDARHTALLVIDMQNDMLDARGSFASNGEDVTLARAVVGPVIRLIEAARRAGVMLVYTQNTTLSDGASDSPAWTYFKSYSRPALAGEYTVDGTWGHELIPELNPGSGEVTVRKHRSDAFIGTSLDLILRSNAIQSVVACGVMTNGCVEATIRHAAFADYYTVVVSDCCASTSQRMHDLAIELLGARHDVVESAVIARIWGA